MSLAFEILGIGAPNDAINRTFDVLPVDCMALIKEYVPLDRRAPHPVAVLVQRSRARFVLHYMLVRPTR